MASAPPLRPRRRERSPPILPPAASRSAFWRDEFEARPRLRCGAFLRDPTRRGCCASTRVSSIASSRGVWREAAMPAGVGALAVGGYGRGQLFPHSDVDVLILLPAKRPTPSRHHRTVLRAHSGTSASELGHAVRTVDAVRIGDEQRRHDPDQPPRDIASLDGSRPLTGSSARMFAETLDVRAFYAAETLEQQQRHQKVNDAAYNLEPNVKESPGGIARPADSAVDQRAPPALGSTWAELARHGLHHDRRGARRLRARSASSARLRVRLHYLSERREDRLVFDQQAALATQLRLVDTRRRGAPASC